MSALGYEYNNQDQYGGGGGGGFMPGVGDYGGGMGGPQSNMLSPQAGGKGGGREHKSLIPFTVAQLFTASTTEADDLFKIDGADLHQVKIVGQIVDVEESATTRLYKVDDGTGVVGCRIFVDQGESDYVQERRAACQKGAYVAVVGQLREYQGHRHLSVHDMRVVKEGNEVTCHLLEAIYAHCCHTKGRPASAHNQKGMGMGMGMMQQPGMGMGMGMGMGGYGQPAMAMGGGGGGMGGGGAGGLTAVQQAVLEAFQQDMGGDAGVDVSQVVRLLGERNISAQQVKQATEFLANEGHIYTTTDETHYKATG